MTLVFSPSTALSGARTRTGGAGIVHDRALDGVVVHPDVQQSVMHLLSTDRWQIKLTKCSFAKQQIAYLGHVISQQ